MTLGSKHGSVLLDVGGSLLRVHLCKLSGSLWVESCLLQLLVVVEFFSVLDWILSVVFVHYFQVDLVMHLKPSKLNLLLPHLIVELHVI